jgi:hypothetical protein
MPFPAKEAAAIEAEAELWTAYLTALAGRELSGAILGELHQTLAAAAAGLDPSWDERFLATRRLIAGAVAVSSGGARRSGRRGAPERGAGVRRERGAGVRPRRAGGGVS